MIFIGVDQSKRFSHYTIGDKDGNIFKRAKVSNEAKDIRKLMESLPEEPKKAALEASRAWGWLHDELEKYADEVLLGNPLQMKAIAHAKVKTDSIDSETIYDLLRADLLPTCFVPPPQIREVKDQLRFRGFLVRIRTMVKNHIHTLIDRNHVLGPEVRSVKDLFSKTGLLALKDVGLPLPERQILDEYLLLLEHLEARLDVSKGWIDSLYEASSEAKLLDTIPGFGRFLAVLVQYEIGDIHRFESAKKLCSYAGLVPSVYASGGKTFYGKITKQGNSHLRWALIEAVMPATVSNAYLRSQYESIKQRKGGKVARVAIARKLLEWVYRVWKQRQCFETVLSQAILVYS